MLVLFTMLCYLLLDYQLRFIINDHFSVCDLRAKKPFKTLLHTMHEHCPLVIIKKARSDVTQWSDIFFERAISFSYSRNLTNCLTLKEAGGVQKCPLVRRSPAISHRIVLWSQKFLTLSINISTRRY